jgi:DNA-directed RNA polymerase specialized sigma subunit
MKERTNLTSKKLWMQPNDKRNKEIYDLYKQGWSSIKIGKKYDITPCRVLQILKKFK